MTLHLRGYWYSPLQGASTSPGAFLREVVFFIEVSVIVNKQVCSSIQNRDYIVYFVPVLMMLLIIAMLIILLIIRGEKDQTSTSLYAFFFVICDTN